MPSEPPAATLPPPRRRLPPEERREHLLATAVKLFTTRPASEVSMADVAREAGVSKALAFRYFENKRALFLEAVSTALEEMEAGSDPDPDLPADRRFREGLSEYLAVSERYPHALRSFMAGDLGRDPEVQALVQAASARTVDRIIARMGVTEPTPRLRHAVRSWLQFVRACNMEWLEHREVSRDTLIDLEIATFRAAVAQSLPLPDVADGGPFLP